MSGLKKGVPERMLPLGSLFLLSVLGLYFVLWRVAPEKTVVAMQASMAVFSHVLLPLCLVFLLMTGLNLFLKPPHVARFLGKGTTVKVKIVAALAGIISAGPIYAWYPILKDLRERGAEHSLIAVFLVNRAVKPVLLPVMVSIFGWAYVLILTLLTIAGSVCVGFIVGALVDSPSGSR